MGKEPKIRERVEVKRISALPGTTLLHATFITQNFARHSHDGFAVGVIEDGVLEFTYRREKLAATPGRISLVNPDEPHDGHSATQTGWTHRMFYLEPKVLEQAAEQLRDKPVSLPFFQKGVIDDHDLATEIHALHIELSDMLLGRMEMESKMLHMLARFIKRHADRSYPVLKIGAEHRAVSTLKKMIEDLYFEDLSLQDYSNEVGLSPFHLIRVFKAQTGLTPHKYLCQIRVRRAEEMIKNGMPLVDAALNAGFVDQSHMNRHFKGIVGLSPGIYRNFLQDAS
jgi:AraC-like DNA-binding protein